MMAQDMFEENKVLQAEVDGFRSLIERWIPHMTSQMHDVDKMRDDFEEVVLDELAGIPEITDREFDTLDKIIDKYYRVSKIYSSGEGRLADE